MTANAASPEQRQRALQWLIRVALVAMVVMGLILMFLLTQATANQNLYEKYYQYLFIINMVVAALLFAVIVWVALRMLSRLRQKKFGSQLLVRLAAVFALAGFAPGVLIYVVSYQFVARSIESWFDVQVESALDAGLKLGRTTLETLSADLSSKAFAGASQLADNPRQQLALALERTRDTLGVDDLMLWSASGRLVASAGRSRYDFNPERPLQQYFLAARNQRVVTWNEGLEDTDSGLPAHARIKALVLLAPAGWGQLGEAAYLQATQTLPATLVANTLAVSQANREYQERALARAGLKRMYIGTLTLSLFMAVFGGILLAVMLGNQIARPLLVLANGVREVAAGNLAPKPSLQGKDELDGLTRSFAQMTQQLADARQAVHDSMSVVSAARANLQTILDNLTAGVLVLDVQGRILSSNPGATRILKLPLAALEQHRLQDVHGLHAFGQAVASQFEGFFNRGNTRQLDHWQQIFELEDASNPHASPAAASPKPVTTLVARGAELPDGQRLLVFDDITEVVSAQRSQAWGEVARRLAHEIKNPLTPIQLAAERLEMKLADKLPRVEQALVTKSVKTIVDQVDAMKRLVNEFRDYARLPRAELQPIDLNALTTEVLSLYADGHPPVPILADLQSPCPLILGDAQQLRQVLHNLLQNAQDATLSAGRTGEAHAVAVKTRFASQTQRVRLTVLDQGTGFAEHILQRAFEPYVTTKDKGTGLGLAVVKKIAEEHGTRVDLANRLQDGQTLGAQVSLSFAAIMTEPEAAG
jgi:nitrogen fixation/metabolism regulation signal transduction histidine kinase